MKIPTVSFRGLIWVALSGLVFAPGVSGRDLLDYLLSRNDLQAITVTDLTSAGKLHRLPSPGHPVYYAPVSAGFIDLGGIKAGEKPIERQLVNATMLKVLAKQGYLPAARDQRPDIVLAWSWGTLNTEKAPSLYPSYLIQLNRQRMLRFLGGDRLGLASKTEDAFPELSLSPGLVLNGDAQNLRDAASDDLYVAVVAAYDINLTERKRATLLWNTRISCPARGFWLPTAFPAMMAIGGPYLGRETAKPVWIHATDKFRPEIKLGDPKVIEYLERDHMAVTDVGSSR